VDQFFAADHDEGLDKVTSGLGFGREFQAMLGSVYSEIGQ
jgi:hypothetical protein